MTELMMECFDSPDEVKILLGKCADFITSYIRASQEAGADGVILAEPAAGLLSPALAEEFSTPFVKRIFDAVDRDDFVLCYHNCGRSAEDMADSLSALPADVFHFGNAVNLKKMLAAMPADRIVMGNVDPVLFRRGTPEGIRGDVRRVYNDCGGYDNFMISSGCDIPAASGWDNIDAYFDEVKAIYGTCRH
jgi:uroporphyrinogen decarboxylase